MTRFTLDGQLAEAAPGETIWDVARRLGQEIPHLCHRPRPGYRADGNCRACLVEIQGERVLAPSCRRQPSEGMVVTSEASARAQAARRMVFELLLADMPDGAARDETREFSRWQQSLGVTASRFAPDRPAPPPDLSHPAMAVQLDACIQCGLCQRACREVQHNDVIGLAARGAATFVSFDLADAMGASSCVGCGECVQACPTGALLPQSVLQDGRRGAAPDRVVDSVCPYCGVGCQVALHVQGDRIIEVTGRDGPANLGRLCVKGRFGLDYARHPERLLRPLVRRDGAAKDPADCLDPAAARHKFREASWEEAMAIAAAGLARIRGTQGGTALAGFGSAKGSNEEAYLFQKLVRTGFGSNNVDHCTRLCHAASVAALLEGVGSAAVTAPFTAAAQSDVILVIGARPTENHPVASSFLKDAAARGAALIVMDPRGNGLDRHAEEVVRFTPGEDVALLNALLHVVIAEQLHDRQFVAARLDDFDRLAAHVADWTPERAALLCGVAPDQIRRVARRFARAEAALVLWGMGISQSVHGTDNARALIALALVCGQVGRPGTGLHPLRGQNNVQGASDAGLIPMMFPDYHRTGDAGYRAKLETLWGATLDPRPGLTVVEVLHAAERGEVHGMYIMGENPAMSDPDLDHARRGLAGLQHLVVQDIFLTETAVLADVILSASAWVEKDGTVTNTNRQVQMGRAALPLAGEARQDLHIIIDLARRLGLDWRYDHVRDVYAEMAQAMPSLDHISWERLEREGSVTYPCHAPDAAGEEIVFHDHFPTADGRARLVPAGPDPAAPEAPDADFPFVLITGRELEHWHTGAMTRRAAVLDALEPVATVSMAPQDCARLGLVPGALVQVATRRGSLRLAVRADADVQPGTLFIPFAYREAAANLLTSPQLDPFGKIPGFKYAAARLEAAAEPA